MAAGSRVHDTHPRYSQRPLAISVSVQKGVEPLQRSGDQQKKFARPGSSSIGHARYLGLKPDSLWQSVPPCIHLFCLGFREGLSKGFLVS